MKANPSETIQPPNLPKRLPVEVLAHLEEDQEYDSVEVTGCDLTNQTAAKVRFEGSCLRRTLLTGSQLPRLRLLDVRLEACDLSGAFLEEARFLRVEFSNCRLLGAQLLSAQLDDLVFKECNLEGAVFASSNTRALSFERCNLRNASFEGAHLEGVLFGQCDLTEADLRNTNLQKADLRGSILDGLQVAAKDMHGAIISPSQAVQTVGLLGITVLDEEL